MSEQQSNIPVPAEAPSPRLFNLVVMTEDQIQFLGRAIMEATDGAAKAERERIRDVEQRPAGIISDRADATESLEEAYFQEIEGYFGDEPEQRLNFFLRLASGTNGWDAAMAVQVAPRLFPVHRMTVLEALHRIVQRDGEWEGSPRPGEGIWLGSVEPQMTVKEREWIRRRKLGWILDEVEEPGSL